MVRRIPLGRLGKPHGIHGELRLLPYSHPCVALRAGYSVMLGHSAGRAQQHYVEKVRTQAPVLVLKLRGVDSREGAVALRGAELSISEDQLPRLQAGELYCYQLVGLRVLTTAGETIGTITDTFFGGAHDVWVVRARRREVLIPAVDGIVRRVDLSGGQVVIEPPLGLLDEACSSIS